MTELRRDAAYVRTHVRTQTKRRHASLSAFDEEVCGVLASPHTVVSAAKTLAGTRTPSPVPDKDDLKDGLDADLESRVADAMNHLLQAERIELSPDA
ncbi:MAG: hypothetical protein SXG53_08745 [Pseudomonadota bacterium]|nr:hypothetical protein [Pseudomonadota bacterium]